MTVADSSLLDYETDPAPTVTVVATSTDGSTSNQAFTITLTDDTSESVVGAISDTDGAANSVGENVANGAVVGITAFATDPDATDTISYSLSNDAGGAFTIDPTTGIVTVADSSLLDYETATSETIDVTALASAVIPTTLPLAALSDTLFAAPSVSITGVTENSVLSSVRPTTKLCTLVLPSLLRILTRWVSRSEPPQEETSVLRSAADEVGADGSSEERD